MWCRILRYKFTKFRGWRVYPINKPEISEWQAEHVGERWYEVRARETTHVNKIRGRAIAQAVSRRLPTAAARVRAWVWSCVICGGQSGSGAGFLRVLRFPLPIFISPIAAESPSSIIWVWYNRPVMTAAPSGLSLTPLRIKQIIVRFVVMSLETSAVTSLETRTVTSLETHTV
jgi:hypothetical protein